MARSDILSLFPEERRVVDSEEHRHRRFVDGNRRQRFRILYITDSVTYLKLIQSDDSTDVTTVDTVGTDMTHTLESMEFLNLSLLHRAITVSDGHLHAVQHLTPMNTSHGDTSQIT